MVIARQERQQQLATERSPPSVAWRCETEQRQHHHLHFDGKEKIVTVRYLVKVFVFAVALLGCGLTIRANAQVPGFGGGGFSGEIRGITHLIGKVVCVACTLEEVRSAQPTLPHLYQLMHARGQLVIAVHEVNRSALWDAWPSRLAIRTPDHLFQQLTTEANMFKNVELFGLFSRGGRTFDVFQVALAEG